MNAFTLAYCNLKIKVFYSYFQHYETTHAVRTNCSNFQILLNLNGIYVKYYYITFTWS